MNYGLSPDIMMMIMSMINPNLMKEWGQRMGTLEDSPLRALGEQLGTMEDSPMRMWAEYLATPEPRPPMEFYLRGRR